MTAVAAQVGRAAGLRERYAAVRRFTEHLVEPLAPEDCVVQSMPDASPTRWHLAHTTWFFETFLLGRYAPDYRPFHPAYAVLFNSYYNQVGEQFPRPRRGLLSRPTVAEMRRYRDHVDAAVDALLRNAPEEALPILELGLHHEQQHQELILTDIKHMLSCNPLLPAYREDAAPAASRPAPPLGWVEFPEGIRWIGWEGRGFAFDNEGPRHRVFCHSWAMADRLVTNGEYLAFMEDGGYRRPELWLSLGWSAVKAEGWQAPLHWVRDEGGWREFTLGGPRPLDPAQPVCHVSLFEADAYARWAGARLPSEAEWESAVASAGPEGGFVENGWFHPAPAPEGTGVRQMLGDVWEWTSSSYAAYPGYVPASGALGEYNGKFMCGQYVLRGGSCATSRSHIRATYRNFFPPDARWQFSGIRLAR